jgi:transglutaminase-like putative cysteine protease
LSEVLPRAALLRLLLVEALVLAPHAPHLPLWADLFVAAVLLWRVLVALRGWRMLPRAARMALTLAAFGGVYASFGRVSGQSAGVALLLVMAALKLTELARRRDLMVMVFLMYFILVTHFLFSQEIWTAAYLIVCAAAITAVLIEANHPGSALPLRTAFGLGGRMVLQALPLMVLIFVLFPRIPGPLWGLPADAGAARSGLSDSMQPGDISALVDSDAVAFRVRFDDAAPPRRERYWRGPVFARFDGRRWQAGARPPEAEHAEARLEAPAYRYEVVLEPHRQKWLFAIDLPAGQSLPPDTELGPDQLLLARREVRERLLYRIESHPRYQLQPRLPEALRRQMLLLPKNYNPRALALAQRWRQEQPDEATIVNAALTLFRSQPFYYTLHPPALGRHSVDEFLFDTRRGFCEHYASSFTVLMRAAGIPARVVTGYQGGERNAVGDYYIVRQSDAHAWSEVWLAGRGWVRVDPTAAVAPQRIERGVGEALLPGGELPGFLDPARRGGFRFSLQARWDWLNAQWNRWVLAYGPDLQMQFLRHLGLLSFRDMILALSFSVTLVLGLLGVLILRQALPPPDQDRARRLWRRLQRRLRRAGFEQAAAEGPQDFVERVVAQRPQLEPALRAALSAYLRLRYLGETDAGGEQGLLRAVRAVRT